MRGSGRVGSVTKVVGGCGRVLDGIWTRQAHGHACNIVTHNTPKPTHTQTSPDPHTVNGMYKGRIVKIARHNDMMIVAAHDDGMMMMMMMCIVQLVVYSVHVTDDK